MNHQPNTHASLNEADPWRSLLAYVLQDDLHNRLTPRVIDIAYTAFMIAKQPNTEDGGSSDWFNDARPTVQKAIEKLRSALVAPGAAIDAREQGSPELLLGWKRYEKARKLSPFQWNRLHIRNLAGENFDAMIDSLPEPTTPVPTPSEVLSPATVAQPVGDEDDKRNARGTSFRVEDLKLPLPALPEPFIASTEIGYSLHRAPEVLRFGADCYRLAQAAQPCASQGCGGAVLPNLVRQLLATCDIDDGTTGLVKEVRAALSTDKSGGEA